MTVFWQIDNPKPICYLNFFEVWGIKKNKKKITVQISDRATSIKIIYKQSSGTGLPSHVLAQP